MSAPHLTPADLADRFQVPIKTIYGWNSDRTGPRYLKVGRYVRYRRADVEAWEKGQQVRCDTR